MVFDSTDEDKELIKKYNYIFNGIRDKIKEINSDECDYEKGTWKLKLIQMITLPLKFHLMTITIRFVFEEDGKIYPQVFLDTWHELNVCV